MKETTMLTTPALEKLTLPMTPTTTLPPATLKKKMTTTMMKLMSE